MTPTGKPESERIVRCDKCSRIMNGQWTRCTCPDGPTRQKIPEAWKRGSRT